MSTTLHNAQEHALEAAENKGHNMMMGIPAGYVNGTQTECTNCGTPYKPLGRGLCTACYMYERRTCNTRKGNRSIG
jgi:hypothetical protein